MGRTSILVALVVACVTVTTSPPVYADDVEAVKAMIKRAEKAYAECDVKWLEGATHADFFGLAPDGSVQGSNMERMKAGCKAGAKYVFNISISKVEVHGRWAFAAGRNTGTFTPPGKKAIELNDRWSAIFKKDGGRWKSYHLHTSPIQTPPS